MIIQRKTQIILALLVSTVFLFQNCATIGRGTSQKIPVTSDPSGAKIIVDGKEIGYAPLELKLKKKKSHIIRIEKKGYNPLEIRITRKTSLARTIFENILWGCGGVCLGFMVGMSLPENGMRITNGIKGGIVGGILVWGGTTLIDFLLGANYALSPKQLNVTLTKIEGKSQSNVILVDAEQFQNIKWIRIKCNDSDGEEEIVNID